MSRSSQSWVSRAVLVVPAAVAAVLVGAGAAWATQLTLSGQTMEGDLQLPPGSTVGAGYDVTVPAGTTVQVTGATVTLHYACAQNGPAVGALTLSFSDATLTGGSGWQPSGDQQSPQVWQIPSQSVANATSACNGSNVWVNSHTGGADFTGDFASNPADQKLSVRFHYRETNPHSTSGSWSATEAVTTSTAPSHTSTTQCPNGQTMNSSGQCTTPQTPSCPNGHTMNSSGRCTTPASTTTCPSGQTMNSAGQCTTPASTTTCPSGQTMNAAGQCTTPATTATTPNTPTNVLGLKTTKHLTQPKVIPLRAARTPSTPTSGTLPFTGLDIAAASLCAAAALIVGFFLIRSGRRRRTP